MPVSYSDDLHWRIVWLNVLVEIAAPDVAKVMHVSERTVYRYAERFCATGDVRPFANRRGPAPLLCEFEELFLVHLVLVHPGIYLRELQQKLRNSTGRWVDASTICRALHRLGMTRQRIRHLSLWQSDVKRAEFWAEMSTFDPSMILWVDESGCDCRNALRKYGYAIRGRPPQDYTLELRGKRYSAIGVISTEGVEDVHITQDSVDGNKFLDFVKRSMLPLVMPFDGLNAKSIVVMDNASIHHVDEVIELLISVGVLVRFLPPYSPDMNPIEEVFAEAKHYLQANGSLFDTSMSPSSLILMAFNSISKQNCQAYIQHAGYN